MPAQRTLRSRPAAVTTSPKASPPQVAGASAPPAAPQPLLYGYWGHGILEDPWKDYRDAHGDAATNVMKALAQ